MLTRKELDTAIHAVQKLIFWANSGYDEDLEPHWTTEEACLAGRLTADFCSFFSEMEGKE